MKLEEVNTRTKEAVDFLVAALESGHSEVLTVLHPLWHGDANLLRERLEAVQQTAAVPRGHWPLDGAKLTPKLIQPDAVAFPLNEAVWRPYRALRSGNSKSKVPDLLF